MCVTHKAVRTIGGWKSNWTVKLFLHLKHVKWWLTYCPHLFFLIFCDTGYFFSSHKLWEMTKNKTKNAETCPIASYVLHLRGNVVKRVVMQVNLRHMQIEYTFESVASTETISYINIRCDMFNRCSNVQSTWKLSNEVVLWVGMFHMYLCSRVHHQCTLPWCPLRSFTVSKRLTPY